MAQYTSNNAVTVFAALVYLENRILNTVPKAAQAVVEAKLRRLDRFDQRG